MHVHTQASSHNRTHIRSPGLCVRDTHVGNVLLVNVCNSSQTSDARAVSVLWIAPAFLVSLLAFVFFYQSLPVVLSRTESVVCVCGSVCANAHAPYACIVATCINTRLARSCTANRRPGVERPPHNGGGEQRDHPQERQRRSSA